MFLGTFTPPWLFILIWDQLLFHSHSTTVELGIQDTTLSAFVHPMQGEYVVAFVWKLLKISRL